MEDATESVAAAVAQSRPETAEEDRLLIEWLRNHNVPCPLCGYNLRALQTARCPECAQRLRLSVALADATMGAWIALIVALLLPASFGAVIIVVFLFVFAHEGAHVLQFPNFPAGPCFLLFYLVSSVPLAIAALMYRRRFLRWPVESQRTCAGLAWAALGITVVILLFEALV